MKARFTFLFNQRNRSLFYSILVLSLFIGGITFVNSSNAEKKKDIRESLSPINDPNFPTEFDTRAIHGTPRGTELFQPTAIQAKAIASLVNSLGLSSANLLNVKYNGLTATPKHLFVRGGFLTEPSIAPPETIARNFLSANKGIFRFTADDLDNMKVTSRAKHPKSGTTTLLLTQQKDGLNYFNGAVLVNVAKNGQILNVGGENYPDLEVTNATSITAAQAVTLAATDLGLSGYTLNSEGSTPVLSTFGNLEPEYITGERFTSNGFFGDDVIVTQVVFPKGATGRIAYKFILTTPQYLGVMWQNIVDAQTGEVLRRSSRTAFQQKPSLKKTNRTSDLGPVGGGQGIGRLPSYRPDVQEMVEGFNSGGTAQGNVFDTVPTLLSGADGHGRRNRVSGSGPGDWMYASPTYAPTGATGTATGRGFTYQFLQQKNEQALPWLGTPATNFSHTQLPGFLGQVLRGFPDATNPSTGSPFGWFYLPTDTAGAEITSGDNNRDITRAAGYSMNAAAVVRNQVNSGNSPNGATGDQPFSADVTPLSSSVTLNDGRVLSSVYESRYTEGNAVIVADDHASNNEGDHGIKGYNATRNYTDPYFDFYNFYEYGNIDASGGTGMTTTFPATTHPDIFPGTTTLFFSNNILHDYLYEIGFTEQFWNFQMDNFGKGGAGGDPVSAQVQDGSGVNNANFGTPDDGNTYPRMQMFLWTEGGARRADGDFDFDVVAHELYHGVSNRSASKGTGDCLGVTLVGESGGMGEGWGDALGASMTDDDSLGEYVTGEQDRAIRRLPQSNYRWSYGGTSQNVLNRRDGGVPDPSPGGIPFQVHSIGEFWSSTLWDMRELLIMKDPNGSFYDGGRRLGGGTQFFIGGNQVTSVDTLHPIDYRASFGTSIGTTPTVDPITHIVRPGLVAAEIDTVGNRNGPLATATSNGARLSDTLVLRGLQLSPCNPSFVDMRDSILLGDRELTGGENQAVIWRAFASHGVGVLATSSGGSSNDQGSQSAPVIVEDFSVPVGVTECETAGPIAAPTFTATNTLANQADISITTQVGATQYVIARSTSASGPFATIATVDSTPITTTFSDDDGGQGLNVGQTFYYQVHAVRNPECVGIANTQSVTINIGNTIVVAPVFFGVANVTDTRSNTSLTVNWSPATSADPTATVVYDVFRVESISTVSGQNDSTLTPSFTPSAANRIAQGIAGVSYADTGLTLGQIYYYIVQARDTNNGTVDTNNVGNTKAKFAAPTSNTVASTPFSFEDFEASSANGRFTPALVDSAGANVMTAVWQRATGVDFLVGDNLAQSTVMYAPDHDPAGDGTGLGSDISTVIGPITLTETSVMEFQSRFNTEAAFDGGVLEIAVGGPSFPQVFPDNVTNFDINYFAYESGYSGPLNGTLAGPVILSALQGRYAFDGIRATKLTRIALGEFAPGGEFNAAGANVYFRFRMTSDAATSPGQGSGWFIDDLIINDYEAAVTALGIEADVSPRSLGDGVVTATDIIQTRRFAVGLDPYDPGFNEFQRTDTAPLATNGDGVVAATDIIQTRRFQVGLDTVPDAAGPTGPSSFYDGRGVSSDLSSPRRVRIVDTKAFAGKSVEVTLEADAVGDETIYGFSLDYNPKHLSNPRVSIGANAINGQVVSNTTKDGQIGFLVDLLGDTMIAGNHRQLITIRFDVSDEADVKETILEFSNSLAVKEVSDNSANALPINFQNGKVFIYRSEETK